MFTPRSPYNSYFADSLITAFKSSGHLLIVDKHTQLSWPGFYIQDAKTMNRIMNVSVLLPNLNVYLPPANQSAVFSDVLFINLGPYPLRIFDYMGNPVQTIAGVPTFTYAQLTAPLPYANPFFTVTNPSPVVTIQHVEFTSPVAAKSVLLKGTGIAGVPIVEELDLKAGTTTTALRFGSITSAVNTSDVDLTGVTAKIPAIEGAYAWNYIDSPGVTIQALNRFADLKQIFDPNRTPGNLFLFIDPLSSAGGTVKLDIYVNGSLDHLSRTIPSTPGNFTLENISGVVNVTTTSINPISVRLQTIATDSPFDIIETQNISASSGRANDNYQPWVVPAKFTLSLTIPVTLNNGSVTLLMKTVTGYKWPVQIVIPNNTTASPVSYSVEIENEASSSHYLYVSCESLKNDITQSVGQVTYTNVLLTYPAVNGREEVIVVDVPSLAPGAEATTYNNPTVPACILEFSGTATGPINLVVKGTNANGIIETDENVQLVPPTSGTLTHLTGISNLQFVTVTEILNNSTQDITDFVCQQRLDPPPPEEPFYHVTSSPLTGTSQEIDSLNATASANFYWGLYADELKIDNTINNAYEIIGNNYYGFSYNSPGYSFNKASIQYIPYVLGNAQILFAMNNSYYLRCKTTYNGGSVGSFALQGPTNAIINYPLVYLPPNRYLVSSAQSMSLRITGLTPSITPGNNPIETSENIDLLAGESKLTSTTFSEITKVSIQNVSGNYSPAFSVKNPARTYLGNSYPNFFVVKTQSVTAGQIININQDYKNRRPKLFADSDLVSSDNWMQVKGINNLYQEQTVNIRKYGSGSSISLSNDITPEFLFVTEVKNIQVSGSSNMTLAWAPASDVLYTKTPHYNPSIASTTQAKNGYVALAPVEHGETAELLKLPPPVACILEVYCDQITWKAGSPRPAGNPSIYLRGTNNSGIYLKGDPYNIVEEEVFIEEGKWIKTKKQFLYLFEVRTIFAPTFSTQAFDNSWAKIDITNLQIRTIPVAPMPDTGYVYNNTSLIYGNNNIYTDIVNPPSDPEQGLQTLRLHGNAGATLLLEGKANDEINTETVLIGSTGQRNSVNEYNYVIQVTNVGSTNATGVWIEGLSKGGNPEIIFINNGSAQAANPIPLEGNPPADFPPRQLTLISDVASASGGFVYLIGKDGDGITLPEEVPIIDGRVNTTREYTSLSKAYNMTGVQLDVGFTTEAEGVEGIAHYLYVTDNSTKAGVWAKMPFGAFLNDTHGRAAVGPGIFFDDGTFSEYVETKIITSISKLELSIEDRAKALIYRGTPGHDVTWVLPTIGGETGLFFYIHNTSRNALIVTTSGEMLNEGIDTSVKLLPTQSLIAVAVLNGEVTEWITACCNVPVQISAPPLLFPVVTTSGELDVSKYPLGTFNNHVISADAELHVILPDPAAVPNGSNVAMVNYSESTAYVESFSSQLINGQSIFYCLPGATNKIIVDNSSGEFAWIALGVVNNPGVYESPPGTVGITTTVTLTRDSNNKSYLFTTNYVIKNEGDYESAAMLIDLSQNTDQFFVGFKVNVLDWGTSFLTPTRTGAQPYYYDQNTTVSAGNLNLNNIGEQHPPASVQNSNYSNQYPVGGTGIWNGFYFDFIGTYNRYGPWPQLPLGGYGNSEAFTSSYCLANAMCFMYDGLNWWNVRP